MIRLYKTLRKARCDSCGFVFKAIELRPRWDGLMVCKKDWEPRHPLDFYRVTRTETGPPWTRPDNYTETFGVPSPVAAGYGFTLEAWLDGDPSGYIWLEDQQYLMTEAAT